MTSRRARLVLVLVVLGVVGVGVFAWDPVYWWSMTKRTYVEADELFLSFSHSKEPKMRGWIRTPRWSDASWPKGPRWGPGLHGRTWYVDSGTRAEEMYGAGGKVRVTNWRPDGTVLKQYEAVQGGRDRSREAPPWRWNVTDQTAPSMPAWMKDDEQWQRALDAQD